MNIAKGETAPKIDSTAPTIDAQAPENTQPAPQAQDPRISSDNARINDLERKERLIRAEARRIKEEKAQLEKEREQYKNRLSPDEWRERFLKDPTSLGISYEDMASRYLQQPSPEEQKYIAMQREIESLRDQLKQSMESIEKGRKSSYEQAVKQISTEVSGLVDKDPQTFELIKATNSQQAVVELIKKTYESEGILMRVEDAAREIEDYLVEEGLKYAGLSKVKAKIMPPAEESAPAPEKGASLKPASTLTHSLQASSKPTSERDRVSRAIAAFRGELK